MRPRNTLDLGVILATLIVSSVVIGLVDYFETRLTAEGVVSLAPWAQHPSQWAPFEREHLALRNSVRRFVFCHFPILSVVGGAAVGIACSSWRRAWVVAIVAMAAVPLTAFCLLYLVPGVAVLASLGYAFLAAAAATASARFMCHLDSGA